MIAIPSINFDLYSEPDTWVFNNLHSITTAMETLAAQRYEEASRNPIDLPFFDTDERLLSEMEICDCSLNLPNPYGYELVRDGLVKTYISPQPDLVTHIYYRGKLNPEEVMCLTFGQFVYPTETRLNRGDRINYLMERAENSKVQTNHPLIQKISPEIYCLSGDRRLIGKTFGLYYC